MTLPLDIVLHIFTILHITAACSTLGKCASLCSSLRYACQRLIFSELEFNFNPGTGYHLALRIVTILSSNARLADFVKSAAIRVVISDDDQLKPVYDLFDRLANRQVTTLLLASPDHLNRSTSVKFQLKVHQFIASLRPTLRILRMSNPPFSVDLLPIQSLDKLEFYNEQSEPPRSSFPDFEPECDISGMGSLQIGHLILRSGCRLDAIPNPTLANSEYDQRASRIDFQSIHTLTVSLRKNKTMDPTLSILLAKTNNPTDLNITLRDPLNLEHNLSQLHPSAFKTVKRLDFDGTFLERHDDIFLGLFDIIHRFTTLESLVITICTFTYCWSFQPEVWEQPVTVLDPVTFPYLKKVEINIRVCGGVRIGGSWVKKLGSSSFARLREFVPEVDCRVLFWHDGMADKNGRIPDIYVIH